jgi:succinate dehydrogenase/fumarate reductase flavoprotein subunit
MLEVSRLMILSALERTETRGVHVRSDCPQTLEKWITHIGWTRGQNAPWHESINQTVTSTMLPTKMVLSKD